MTPGNKVSFDTILNLCKRRGIVFQSSEIYGGLRATWDYGPIGVEMKSNVMRAWWHDLVQLREDVVGLESAIIMHPRTWEVSGHVENFNDPLVECLNCHRRYREEDITGTCPECGGKEFTPSRNFNTMFKTHHGPVEEESGVVWLRPETAQGMFVDFKTVQSTARRKIPFGIAQMGRSFRNEITPGNAIFRTREFDQMEMEFFIKPGTDEKWFDYWVKERMRWYTNLGIRPEKLKVREHGPDELSHYSTRTVDIDFEFPWGWGELEGIANRPGDLKRHADASGEDLSYFDSETEERYYPHVVEPAAGANRSMFAFMIDAYREEEAPSAGGKMEKRSLMRLHPRLAAYKTAVLPLSRHADLVPVAKKVSDSLRPHWMIDYDDAGSIGRRYRRHDEIGTPFCVTVDFDSLQDNAVTIRDRDSMQQERVPVAEIVSVLSKKLAL